MADNFISYQRFTTLPPNIAQYGATVEELQLQAGKPDPNPVVSPMAEAAPLKGLALLPAGSDLMRLSGPLQPQTNPYDGPQLNLTLSRSAVRKLEGNVVAQLGNVVQSGRDLDSSLQTLMQDSLRRVAGMREYLAHLNQMTEYVYVHSIAASKG